MTTRDIQAHLRELYGIEISPELLSTVTDAVLDEVAAWQGRPLEPVYAIVFFDCLRIKIRDEGAVKNKAVYLAIGMRCSGHKEVLGIWIEQTEGAKFWLRVMTEIRNRGTHDVLIAVVDGLKGFPEAINAVFPEALVQTCIVHLICYSMQFASWKERKAIAAALQPIYGAESATAAVARLAEFDASPWGEKYPAIAQSWRRNWEQVIPFFAFPAAVRRIIYTTNAIESLHSKVRKAVRGRGHFPSDEAATKLIWLALRNITAKWKNPPIQWHAAKAQFAIQFEDRFVMTRGRFSTGRLTHRNSYRSGRPHAAADAVATEPTLRPPVPLSCRQLEPAHVELFRRGGRWIVRIAVRTALEIRKVKAAMY
jgi:putative transposase